MTDISVASRPGHSGNSGPRRARSRRSSRHPSDQGPGFFAPLAAIGSGGAAAILAILLLVAMVAGGGGTPAVMAELFVEFTALAALVWAALAHRPELGIWAALRRDPAVMILALAVIVLMLAQLVPLPPSLWSGLPGREAIAENAKAFPDAPWLPFSIDPQRTAAALLSLLPPLAAYLIASGTKATERDWFVPAFALVVAASVLLEIAQLGGQGFLYPANSETFSRGFMANRNAQGDILAIALALLACRPYYGGDRTTFTITQAAAAALLLLAAVLTGSRGGLALCLAAAGLAGLRELWAWRRRGRKAVIAITAGAFVSLAGLAALAATNDNVARTLDRFGQDQNGRTQIIWPDAWYAAQQVLPWGTGFGSFMPVFKIFESQEMLDATLANRAHNEILELLIEGGIPAVALALLAALVVLWRGWQVWRGGATPAARARGAMLLLVSILLIAHSMIDYPVRTLAVSVPWALLLGLVTADRAGAASDMDELAGPGSARQRTLKSSTRRSRRADLTTGQRLRKWGALALLALLVPAGTVIAFDRAQRPLPGGLSCAVPTPLSCRQMIAALIARTPDADFSPLTMGLAKNYPADAELQALHGSELLRHGNPEGTIFLHNSARLGWREPLGQLNAFDAAAAEGDVPRAVFHLDALLRTHPEVVLKTGLLDRILGSEPVRQEWAARLASGPDYLRGLLLFIAGTAHPAPDADEAARAAEAAGWPRRVELLALARANGLQIPPEMARAAVAMAYNGNRQRAADLWVAMAGAGGWGAGKPAWNTTPAAGELPEQAPPFVWSSLPGKHYAFAVERAANKPARFVTNRPLSGPAQRLASIALFMGPGYHELRWRVSGAEPSDFFPVVTCEKGGSASFDLLDPPSTDVGVAAVDIASDCGGAVVAVGKGRGKLAKGAAISEIEIDRKRLLE